MSYTIQITEIQCLGNLPCLEKLQLANNPVTSIVDYRTKVLEVFGDRAKEVCSLKTLLVFILVMMVIFNPKFCFEF